MFFIIISFLSAFRFMYTIQLSSLAIAVSLPLDMAFFLLPYDHNNYNCDHND